MSGPEDKECVPRLQATFVNGNEAFELPTDCFAAAIWFQ
jgi:hypothetical protein